MDELAKLKRKAKKLYLAAQVPDYLDCGRHFAEECWKPGIGIARREFSATWARIRELDPNAPVDPFKESPDA